MKERRKREREKERKFRGQKNNTNNVTPAKFAL
jgi:hypothetical protein